MIKARSVICYEIHSFENDLDIDFIKSTRGSAFRVESAGAATLAWRATISPNLEVLLSLY